MMKKLIIAAAILLSLPAVAQQYKYKPDTALQEQTTSLPWTTAITAGANVWPTSKEKFRLGYTWEADHAIYLLHELAYIQAERLNIFFVDNSYGALEGVQLRNEIRLFPEDDSDSRFYYGAALAYMFTRHKYKKIQGMECDVTGECAYFRRNDEMVSAHTTTVNVIGGVLVPIGKIFYLNFHTGLGLRGTYFPTTKTYAYFGKGIITSETPDFILEPNIRLGVTLLFALTQRK